MSRQLSSRNVGVPLKETDSLFACVPTNSVCISHAKSLVVSEYTPHDILVPTLLQRMMRDQKDEQALHVGYIATKHDCSPMQ